MAAGRPRDLPARLWDPPATEAVTCHAPIRWIRVFTHVSEGGFGYPPHVADRQTEGGYANRPRPGHVVSHAGNTAHPQLTPKSRTLGPLLPVRAAASRTARVVPAVRVGTVEYRPDPLRPVGVPGLGAMPGRLVVAAAHDRLWRVYLAHDSLGVIVRVQIALAVAEPGRSPVTGVAQVHGNRAGQS